MPKYIASIGMEAHAELATRSKMFCRCPVAFGGEPNTRVCPVCLGMPGALPVPNRAAVEMVVRTALALNCSISENCHFSRKNYFYPDLPKGYQISQYSDPIGHSGWLELPVGKRIGIRRVHLEEDTGKLLHLPAGGSGIDYNRAGVPLMEIVTEFPPDISNDQEAKEYLVQLRQILLCLGVCDGKMEEGSLRCEPNISVRPEGQEKLGTKTELKNLNSFRSVQMGVRYEIARQEAVINGGGAVLQETRGWNEDREESFIMRVKETEQDYRYFPDPDLAPMSFDPATIVEWRDGLPELPLAKSQRYQSQLGLSPYDAGVLIGDQEVASFFEEAVALGGDPKTLCNWITQDFARLMNEHGLSPRQTRVAPSHLVDLARLIEGGEINGKIAKEIFQGSFETGAMPSDLVKSRGVSQIADRGQIGALVLEVLNANPDVVAKYKNGHTGVLGFLVGETMKASKGQAKPDLVKELLTEALERA
ncbi:MAG: Asp-tRNA(Asn)/Glu-tRNA(Gln) amidotransferase subunit GatB [Fimbriimonadaceae bacterium]